MCDPMTIAGITLSVGSTVANTIAANQQRQARNDALAAERIRQGALDQEAEALNAQSQDRFGDFEGQQEERSSSLADYFTQQQTDQTEQSAQDAQAMLPESRSNITVREEGARRADAREATNQRGTALASLRSFGDLLGGIGRDQARDASMIGQIGGFRQGSANVLPIELDAANEAGGGARFFGDILGLGGGILTSAGLGGGRSDPWNGMRTVGSRPSNGLVRLFS